jgi:catechol 2,3-dioxygenase-like lactoylglutathione lyase family enzyme
MHFVVVVREPSKRSEPGRKELYIADPDGLVLQLQDARYCGGAGPLGTMCDAREQPPKAGLMVVSGWSHFTNVVSDQARSRRVYQDLFGLRIQAYQGPTAPVLGLDGVQFLMLADGSSQGGTRAPRPVSIDHVCMSMQRFSIESAIKALEECGVRPGSNAQGKPGPLRHYITTRTEARGGAPEGTSELYYTDPDGLLMQLQDATYCGGAGKLGEICL